MQNAEKYPPVDQTKSISRNYQSGHFHSLGCVHYSSSRGPDSVKKERKREIGRCDRNGDNRLHLLYAIFGKSFFFSFFADILLDTILCSSYSYTRNTRIVDGNACGFFPNVISIRTKALFLVQKFENSVRRNEGHREVGFGGKIIWNVIKMLNYL